MKLRSNKIDSITFNTVEELTSFPSSRFSDGAVANVLGYYAPGDGGGGEVYFDANPTREANGGTVYAANGTGVWIRKYQEKTNVLWFGARGDGESDNTAAFQAAIDSVHRSIEDDSFYEFSNEKKFIRTVFIPGGNYRFYTNQTITDRDGNTITCLLNLSGPPGYDGPDASSRSRVGIKLQGERGTLGSLDFQPTWLAAWTTADVGIYYYRGHCAMENISIYGRGNLYRGFWLNTGDWQDGGSLAWWCIFKGMYIDRCHTCFDVESSFKIEIDTCNFTNAYYCAKVSPVTSLVVKNIIVGRFIHTGLYITGECRYGSITGFIADQKLTPTNQNIRFGNSEIPFTNSFGDDSIVTDNWFKNLSTVFGFTFTRAEYDDIKTGYALRVNMTASGSLSVRNIGSEHIFDGGMFLIEGESRGSVTIDGFEGDSGTGWLPESKIGTISSTSAVSTLTKTISTTADYTGSLSVGDLVVIAKRRYTGSGTAPAEGEFLGPDDIVNLPSTTGVNSTLLYGSGYTVSDITPTNISLVRLEGTRFGRWPTAANYPGGVENHIPGDYIFKMKIKESRPVLLLDTEDDRFFVNISNGFNLGRNWGILALQNAVDFVKVLNSGYVNIENSRIEYHDPSTQDFEIKSYPVADGKYTSLGLSRDDTSKYRIRAEDSIVFSDRVVGDGSFSILFDYLSLDDWSVSNTSSQSFIFKSSETGNNNITVHLDSEGKWVLTFTDNAGIESVYNIDPIITLIGSSAYHIALVVDRNGMAVLWVNGVDVGRVDVSNSLAVSPTLNSDGSSFFSGSLVSGYSSNPVVFNSAINDIPERIENNRSILAEDQWGAQAQVLDFESGLGGATMVQAAGTSGSIAINSSSPISGSQDLLVTVTGVGTATFPRVQLPTSFGDEFIAAGKQYRLKFKTKVVSGSPVITICWDNGSAGGGAEGEPFNLALSGSQSHEYVFTQTVVRAIGNVDRAKMTIYSGGSASYSYQIDDVYIEPLGVVSAVEDQGIGRQLIDVTPNLNHAIIDSDPVYSHPEISGIIRSEGQSLADTSTVLEADIIPVNCTVTGVTIGNYAMPMVAASQNLSVRTLTVDRDVSDNVTINRDGTAITGTLASAPVSATVIVSYSK